MKYSLVHKRNALANIRQIETVTCEKFIFWQIFTTLWSVLERFLGNLSLQFPTCSFRKKSCHSCKSSKGPWKNTRSKASVGRFSLFQTENQRVRVGYMDPWSAILRRNKEFVLNLNPRFHKIQNWFWHLTTGITKNQRTGRTNLS